MRLPGRKPLNRQGSRKSLPCMRSDAKSYEPMMLMEDVWLYR
jgi:hypothetical protein